MELERETSASCRAAEEYLRQIPMWTREKNSLDTVRDFLDRLGGPDRDQNLIHVAGTNGKGSVCAFLTSMLMEGGYRVGTFTSPHLSQVRERFLIQGEMVSEDAFVRAFEQVREMADRRAAEGENRPSFFEFVFYMALLIFREARVDYVILETGLGGRLDVTNAVAHPLAAVITSIGLEHTQYLGDTIGQIAGEKAGIIKRGTPVIFDGNQPEASRVIMERAEEMDAPCIPVQRSEILIETRTADGLEAAAETLGGQSVRLKIPFAADYQAMNAMLAFRTMEILRPAGMSLEMMQRGIGRTVWSGRMEQVGPGIFLDGAHNPSGVEALARAAACLQSVTGKPSHLLFAVMEDKDYRSMAACLCEKLKPERVTLARLDNDRAADCEELRELFLKGGAGQAVICSGAGEAFEQALAARNQGQLLFCTGSLYLIGELRELWREKYHD